MGLLYVRTVDEPYRGRNAIRWLLDPAVAEDGNPVLVMDQVDQQFFFNGAGRFYRATPANRGVVTAQEWIAEYAAQRQEVQP